MKKIIRTEAAPAPVGPYSQAIVAGGFVFTAGQIPMDAETAEIVENDIQVQTRKAFENLQLVLEAAGSSLEKVVKTTVFLKDMNDFVKMNEIYAQFFKTDCPARSAVEVARLPKDVLVEVECIALAE